uniref:Uncharacterized protein n=1 Tax=Aegilops tauschii subsp. strangulata TaxID=200361 RepID=A0A453GRI5_AEGTS
MGTEVSTPTGEKSQKVPVSQMVRTDPRDPSGRLHTYWQGQSSNLEKKSDLVSVRYDLHYQVDSVRHFLYCLCCLIWSSVCDP